jgi:poly(hydroxyalkanoate) depolymerase family esterase
LGFLKPSGVSFHGAVQQYSLSPVSMSSASKALASQEHVMRRLAETIARLTAAKRSSSHQDLMGQPSRLAELTEFGPNPGMLKGHFYAPRNLGKGAPLVVVLHGCTQTAAGYDNGAGWSRAADQQGFAVLFPEQQRSNNPNLCFNWFNPSDMQRGHGEPLSIISMVRAMIEKHALDHQRIYVTGLSAGGAMASVMLATYPDIFAGGAIIAGLPYGSATSVPEALDRMRGSGLPSARQLQALIGQASDHRGAWPTISVWHGTRDQTVVPANMEATIAQWCGVHGVGPGPASLQKLGPHTRRIWCDREGVTRIEAFEISGMGHGTPLHSGDGLGSPGPFMLDVGISSTHLICDTWGLNVLKTTSMALKPAAIETGPREEAPENPSPTQARPVSGVTKIIEDALRSAGLMR